MLLNFKYNSFFKREILSYLISNLKKFYITNFLQSAKVI
ncbi:hypothetical protein A1OE_1043 [Candidatus Endolissoclinum faulkneri L2]|uniref:Uncharacterized protein n=1 Tax=Candidatus Endolissoclinum faulkneri L2 TaxID=1193729 RepID=K7ZD61_9PROT|nr:hypothetical protein A1OE_1043 [Candidatus Endolissoclinum faulkneri L2]